MIRGALLVVALALGANVVVAREAVAVAGHPWHDAFAEVRPRPELFCLQVTVRVDAAHLEVAVAERAGRPIDLEAARTDPEQERWVATYAAETIRARWAVSVETDTSADQAAEPDRRLQPHWIGHEFQGDDCLLYLELLTPPVDLDAPSPDDDVARSVEMLVTTLVDQLPEQTITTSILGGETPVFSAERRQWAETGVRLPPRRPLPAQRTDVGRGPHLVVIVPTPRQTGADLRPLVRALSRTARVAVLWWPGLDHEAPPPTDRPGQAGRDWAAHAMALALAEERTRAEARGGRVVLLAMDGLAADVATEVAEAHDRPANDDAGDARDGLPFYVVARSVLEPAPAEGEPDGRAPAAADGDEPWDGRITITMPDPEVRPPLPLLRQDSVLRYVVSMRVRGGGVVPPEPPSAGDTLDAIRRTVRAALGLDAARPSNDP